MNLPKFALEHRSIVLAFIAIILAVGMFNFKTMSRREDPEIIMRDALVVTSWPGASSIRVDELITDPLEDVLVEIPEIVTVRSKSMAGLSVIQVTADDAVTNPDQIWDDVRAKVRVANAELPAGAGPAIVNSDFGDVYEIVFALHQRPNERGFHYSPRELEVIAERIEEELELIDEVARVEFWGNQPERIYVEIDSADWAQLEITAGQLQGLFQSRNIVFPGGEIDTQDARFAVNPTGEFTSIAQIDDLIVGRNEGLPVTLKDLPFSVERRYEEPPRSAARVTTPEFAHRPAIVLGISMKSGRNIADLDRSVEDVITRLKNSVIPPDIELPRVNDLPRQVSTRIVDFQFNLLQGVLIVLAVALLTMGWRPALIMAAAIPLSIISTFAVVRSLGIELEQFSIASLIIALGMVVDNAIVVSDNALRLIREGVPKREAVVDGAHGLAIPILTSTLTTIVAFLPMLTISGNVGEYVASLPVVVATTLASSYVVAMLVTPILCLWLLDKETGSDTSTGFIGRLNERYEHGIQWCLARPGKVVGYAGVAFLASLLLIPVVGSQFFPAGSRDQFFIKVWLPEGSPIGATLSVSRQVEQMLVEESAVPGAETGQRLRNALTVIGTGGPRLMLTQEPEYDYPYYALILVNTTSPLHTEAFAEVMRDRVSRIADARITVDNFMLGPPIKDPVAFRISGPERDEIMRIARAAIEVFKRTPGTVHPYSNWGAPANRLDIEVDSFAANLAGVSNADIAFTTSAFLSGVPLTNYREGDHVVPIMLRTVREKRESLSNIAEIFVNGESGKVPLNAIAKLTPSREPSVIARRNGLPTVTVGSRVEPGTLANRVAARLQPKLERLLLELPPGYTLEQAGELEETAKAQGKVVIAIGIAVLLMVLVLTVQYNSVVKPAVIMAAVPLGLIGVLIGLYVTGWPLGFMAMLGVLALGGIVINNAIVLVDFIEDNVARGEHLRQAVAAAGKVRMRPILLTSLTTIGGLLPLSLFGGALWAPMTNGMIFGLIVSTVLTLFVIPCLYVFMAERAGMKVVAAETGDSLSA